MYSDFTKWKMARALQLKIQDLRAEMPQKSFLIRDPRYNLIFNRSQKGILDSCIGTSTSSKAPVISEEC